MCQLAGWKYDRRTDYETRRLTKLLRTKKIRLHALSIILGYLVCLSWHAYFKPKDHQIIGTPHGATILDIIMKNEAATPPNHGWNSQKMVYQWAMGSFVGQWLPRKKLCTPCRWACQCCVSYADLENEDISEKRIDERVKSCSCN